MHQLRNISESSFLAFVEGQQKEGYQLAFVEDRKRAVAVAGFRISEMLARGKYLSIEDLIADEKKRSKGFGGKLFDWLAQYAKKQKCTELDLDSAVHRFDAHRFYLNKRMEITCHHFTLKL